MNSAYLIGISGGSGSGKTSFLNNLKEKFDNQISFISFDNYYKPRESQETDLAGIKNFDLPKSMEIDAFMKDVQDLLSGKDIQKLEYTFNNDLKESELITTKAHPIVIVEGLFIYHYEELRKLFDFKIFIQADDIKKVIRRIKRDKEERNYPLEDVLYRYEHHVFPSYKKFIEPYLSLVDIIINNNISFDTALEVTEAFLKSKLNSTK